MTSTPTTSNTALTPAALLFEPGDLVATPSALKVLQTHGVKPLALLSRHLLGDWGQVCKDDAACNAQAVHDGSRILSSYEIAQGVTVWVITDAQTDTDTDGHLLPVPTRLCTTVLLPSEY